MRTLQQLAFDDAVHVNQLVSLRQLATELRYIVAVSVDGKKSPDERPCIRLALQFFTNKMRHDVLSEMSGILKARYLISERILFHRS